MLMFDLQYVENRSRRDLQHYIVPQLIQKVEICKDMVVSLCFEIVRVMLKQIALTCL